MTSREGEVMQTTTTTNGTAKRTTNNLVKLARYEMMRAVEVGEERRRRSKETGRRDASGLDKVKKSPEQLLRQDVLGAAAEIAAAKYYNVYPHLAVDVDRAFPDIGVNIQVVHSEYDDAYLPVQKRDNPRFIYVLVTGNFDKHFRVVGAIRGVDAKQKMFLWDPQGRDHEAYFVPPSQLTLKPNRWDRSLAE
jgi:aconitase A